MHHSTRNIGCIGFWWWCVTFGIINFIFWGQGQSQSSG